jgi:hypothetical protein
MRRVCLSVLRVIHLFPLFAHGRFAHFEYLAMELLGRDLGALVEEQGY